MTPLLSVADVCRLLSVSRDFVYSRRQELGVVRLGDSKSAPLRFNPAAVERFIETHTETVA